MTTENQSRTPADDYREELFIQIYFLYNGGESYLNMPLKEYKTLLEAEYERVKK